jgi:hypothetical protein
MLGMRRVNVWFLLPTVLLALAVGTLLGRAVDDNGDSTASSAGPTKVLGSVVTRPETTTTAATDTTETTVSDIATTTTPATVAASTATTVKATSAITTATTATTTASTPTTQRASVAGCGAGSAGVAAKITVNGSGPSSNPTFTYSGPVSVINNTDKAIEVETLVLRLASTDGTNEDVAVAGGPGTVIAPGATKDIAFSHSTSHPPKDNATSVARFSYKPPGGTRACGAV